MHIRDEHGFTLPELVAVAGIVLSLLVVATVLSRPVSYRNVEQDAERRLEVAHIAQAIRAYKAKNGVFPANIPTEPRIIGTQPTDYNICSSLVPEFMPDIPLDPVVGLKYKGDTAQDQQNGPVCTESGVNYFTGYSIQRDNDQVVVAGVATTKDLILIKIR